MMAPYFSASAASLSTGPMSPSMEKTPSVITSLWPGSFAISLQQFLAMGRIFVAEDLDLGAREPRAVDDAGVVELVGEDEVFFAEDRADGAGVGREAALEDHAGLDILEARDLFLELHVDAHGAGDGAHRARAHAVGARGGERGLNELGVVGEAEVVVAGEVDHFAAVVVADRRLLIVEDAQLEMGALGAQVVECGREIGKLRGAWQSPSWRLHLKEKG